MDNDEEDEMTRQDGVIIKKDNTLISHSKSGIGLKHYSFISYSKSMHAVSLSSLILWFMIHSLNI